jgi:hypothetical protein
MDNDSKKYIELLNKYDHAYYVCAYPGTDEQLDQNNLFKLAYEISNGFGNIWKVKAGSSFQDSSCHGEIELLISCDTGIWSVIIRTSSFNKFITLIDEKNALTPNSLEILRKIFIQCGYNYIPFTILNTKYTGPNKGFTGLPGRTWYDRYFGCL